MNRFIDWTGERFVPWIDTKCPEIYFEHYNRYYFALQFVKGKKVLDIASGEGYGSKILSGAALSVTGIDIAEDAVRHASENYACSNLQFMVSDGTEIAIKEDKSFDVVVCFEAIEHIKDQDKLLFEVKRLLKEDGILIVSTPNKVVYTDKLHNNNQYHVSELYFDEFKQLLEKHYKYISYWSQSIHPASVIRPVGKSAGVITEIGVKYEDGLKQVDPSEIEAGYYVAVASEKPLQHTDLFVNLTDIYGSLTNK